MAMPTRDRFAVAAAALFAVGSIVALVHLVWFRPYGMMSVEGSLVLSALLTIVFGVAAGTLAVRARGRVIRSSVVHAWLATFVLLAHGVLLRIQGDRLALAYMIAAMIAAVLVKRAFTPLPWADRATPGTPRRRSPPGDGDDRIL